MICFYSYPEFVMGGFFLPSGFCFSEVRAMSALPFQGGVIFRTFVPDSGFGTYAMLTAMVILP
jgi:hypothetical protein